MEKPAIEKGQIWMLSTGAIVQVVDVWGEFIVVRESSSIEFSSYVLGLEYFNYKIGG